MGRSMLVVSPKTVYNSRGVNSHGLTKGRICARSSPEFALMTANAGPASGAAAFFGRDEESLLSAERLWQRIFPASGTKLWRECWHWLYGGNPFWSTSDCYPLVVYQTGGEIVGQLGLIPTQVRLDGKWTQAAWCIDYHLLPSHQRQGIGRKLLDCALARIPLLLTLGQTDASYGLFLKAGWHGKDQHLIRSRRILRPLPVALKRLGMLGGTKPPNLAQQIPEKAGSFGSLVVDTIPSWASERPNFPALRDAAPDGHGMIARTVEFMEWRYVRHPRLRYTFLKISSRETSQVVAYAVLRFGWHGKYYKASLCDLIPVPYAISYPWDLGTTTVSAIVAFCKACGVEFFETQMSPQPEGAGAMWKLQPGHRFLYGTAHMSECADLPISSWQLAPGDCDVDLLEGMDEIEL